MTFRDACADDLPALVALFRNTVHTVNRKHYSAEQVTAWAPDDIGSERWADLLRSSIVWVAEAETVILGYVAWRSDGYIDHLFTHADYQGRGVASALMNRTEEAARANRVGRLFTEASITAKPFFERRGFLVVREQKVVRRDVTLTNYLMEKWV